MRPCRCNDLPCRRRGAGGPGRDSTGDARSYVDDANKLIAGGNLRGAEIQLRNAARLDPTDPAVHLALAQVYRKLANFPAAEAEARLARQNPGDYPDIADADGTLAWAMLEQGKLTPLFQSIHPADRDPKAESMVRDALGSAHLELREWSEAAPLLHDAEQLDKTALEPKLALVSLALALGDMSGARAEHQALALAPNDLLALRAKATILGAKGDIEGALTQYREILAAHPGDVPTELARAGLLIDQHRADEAQTDIDAALKVQPQNYQAIYLKAALLAIKGNSKAADALLTKVDARFERFPIGYYVEGAVKYSLGQYEQAAAVLAKYEAHAPNDPRPRRLLALIYLRKHDAAQAVSELRPIVMPTRPTRYRSASWRRPTSRLARRTRPWRFIKRRSRRSRRMPGRRRGLRPPSSMSATCSPARATSRRSARPRKARTSRGRSWSCRRCAAAAFRMPPSLPRR